MARPQKNNLDYYSHDSGMRNDIKIKALRRKFGHKGYSVYVMMLEHLASCEYLQFEWNELSIELLTPDFDVDAEELEEIINYGCKLKLFEIDLGILFCPKMLERHSMILTDRKGYNPNNSPLGVLKADLSSKSGKNPSLSGNNTQSKVKESKVKESKEKESKEKESIEKERIVNETIEQLKEKIKTIFNSYNDIIKDLDNGRMDIIERHNKMLFDQNLPLLYQYLKLK